MAQKSVIRQAPLYEQVHRAIRSALLSGDFKPGERLTEKQLAERFGVSRTPVREAFRRLAEEGLVSVDPNAGVRVKAVSVDDMKHLSEVRLALEKVGLQYLLREFRREDLDRLQLALAASQQMAAWPDYDAAELLDRNISFHRQIVACARNPWLESYWEDVCSQIVLFRAAILEDPGDRLEVAREHAEIVRRVRSRDVPGAVQALEYHFLADQMRSIRGLSRAREQAKREGLPAGQREAERSSGGM